MSQSSFALLNQQDRDTATMKALVFYGPGEISLETMPLPRARRAAPCGRGLGLQPGQPDRRARR